MADTVGRVQSRNETLFVVAVPRGVGRAEQRALTLHETGKWLINYSNDFNAMKRTAVLAEVANYVPALTPLAAV